MDDAILNSTALRSIQAFLASIGFDVWYTWLPLVLLVLCLLFRLVCMLLILCTPGHFGKEHEQVMNRMSGTCLWLSVFVQIMLWIFGSTAQMSFLRLVDLYAALACVALAVAAFLCATIGMLFPRRGKRVFIFKRLYRQALVVLLMAMLICLLGWIVMR